MSLWFIIQWISNVFPHGCKIAAVAPGITPSHQHTKQEQSKHEKSVLLTSLLPEKESPEVSCRHFLSSHCLELGHMPILDLLLEKREYVVQIALGQAQSIIVVRQSWEKSNLWSESYNRIMASKNRFYHRCPCGTVSLLRAGPCPWKQKL